MPQYQNGRYREVDIDHEIDDKIFSYNNLNANYNCAKTFSNNHYAPDSNSPSVSPARDLVKSKPIRFDDEDFDARPNPDDMLKIKWMDYSPRMSRLRDQRTKRLMSRLEQFEEWDAEQYQKQKQFEVAREQRHRNIVDRLKTQDFCVNQMLKRHESDIETTRELDTYVQEHLYIEAAPDPIIKNGGPINEFRRFEAEMNDKLKILEDEIDELNPKYKIQQSLLPRLERARDTYSLEPEVYTTRGKRVLKKPKLGPNGSIRASVDRDSKSSRGYYGDYDFDDDYKGIKYYFPTALNNNDLYDRARMQYGLDKIKSQEKHNKEASPVKPIISYKNKGPAEVVVEIAPENSVKPANSSEKRVLFKDEVVEAKSVESVAVKNHDVEEELASEMVVKENPSAC